MYPNSRSPCAAWLRFMKSKSMVSHGSSTLACVCRCSSGVRSASRPAIHILAGENVCIHAITPMTESSALASSAARRIASESVRTGFQTTFAGQRVARARAAISCDCVGDLAQRLLAVQALAAGEEPDLAVGVGLAHDRLRGRGWAAVRRRSGSGRRGSRCRRCAIGTVSPSWRAMCTVRATSSTITAALTAALASLPMVNGPWLRMSTAGLRESAQGLDDAAADRVVADERERADRHVAAELVGHHRQHARHRLAARGPGRRVGRVGVHDAADVRHVPVDVRVRGGVAGRRAGPVDEVAVQVADDHRLRRQLVVGDARRLDDEQVVGAGRRADDDALRHVARRPHDEAPARAARRAGSRRPRGCARSRRARSAGRCSQRLHRGPLDGQPGAVALEVGVEAADVVGVRLRPSSTRRPRRPAPSR